MLIIYIFIVVAVLVFLYENRLPIACWIIQRRDRHQQIAPPPTRAFGLIDAILYPNQYLEDQER